jgi:hypothetical protein
MELWDEEYVNMERQAFVEIGPDNLGSFQFGLVRGQLDGYLESLGEPPDREPPASTQPVTVRFAFTWDGFDEMDERSGSGWMRLTGVNEAIGVIKLHLGDHSTFRAQRASASRSRRGKPPRGGGRT